MPAEPTSDQTYIKGSGVRSDLKGRRCGLAQCRKTDCSLKSHRQFALLRYQRCNTNANSAGNIHDLVLRYQLNDGLLERTVMRIQSLIMEGVAPSTTKNDCSMLFKPLAHHYFSSQMDRLIQAFSPQLDRERYKTTMIEHALSSDTFCICITANAKIEMLMQNHIRIPDRASESVYAITAYALRQKLDNFRSTEVDWLLVLVIALVGFDLAFDRHTTLRGHHQALKNLIGMNGGIHNIGHTLPYVLNTERFLAFFTGSYPIFKQTPLMPVSQRYEGSQGPYGSVFRTVRVSKAVDQPVKKFCLDECHLLHVMETCNILLTPNRSPSSDPSALPYFLFLRDRLAAEGACLHADYHENQSSSTTHTTKARSHPPATPKSKTLSKSRCILLAVLIVEYIVIHVDYYTVKGPFLAKQLLRILHQQDSCEWEEHRDVLLWLLTAAAMPEQWEDRRLIVQKLKTLVKVEFQSIWPRGDWRFKLKMKLKTFVWSERLEIRYRRLCDELIKEPD